MKKILFFVVLNITALSTFIYYTHKKITVIESNQDKIAKRIEEQIAEDMRWRTYSSQFFQTFFSFQQELLKQVMQRNTASDEEELSGPRLQTVETRSLSERPIQMPDADS